MLIKIFLGLNTIFDYFKNGVGRHLATNSPAIEIEDEQDSYGKFHDAGWDSFCTGYVFIRLAHLKIYQNYPLSKQFVSSEHIGGVEQYKNRVNIIRGSVPYTVSKFYCQIYYFFNAFRNIIILFMFFYILHS